MKPLNHIKLAAFTGLLVGSVQGTIDIIIRIAVLSFEWFEFYQSLLIPIIVYTLGFAVISVLIELIRSIIKIRIANKDLTMFYFVSSVLLLAIFYPMVILNRFILSDLMFWNPISIVLNSGLFLVFGLACILLMTKAKVIIFNFMSNMKSWKIKKIAKNYVFIIIVFIIISLILDLFLLEYIPNSKPNTDLDNFPNVLLVVVDALRADHLGLYGYSYNTTPNIDEFAKNAVVFDNAIGPASGSLPSISSIFTGKYLSNHRSTVALNPELSIKETTLAEELKSKGYNTAGFVAAIYYKAKYGVGQGFNTYKDRMDFFEFQHTFEWFGLRQSLNTFFNNYKFLVKQDGYVTSSEVNEKVLKWIEKNQNQPFFLFVHYADPHYPYNLNNKYLKDFRNNTESYPQNQDPTASFEEIINLKSEDFFQQYDASIKYSDSNVRKLLNKLEELNLKDNTIIIITADHGLDYYDHGIVTGESMYQSMIHVPLIIYYPKGLKAQRIKTTVSIIDIFPTIFDMLNMEVPDNIDGTSLLPLMTGEGTYNREFVASETFGRPEIGEALQQIAIIKGDWKLIEIRGSEILSPGLYNLRTDPSEQRNLYDIYIKKRKELQQHIPEITNTIVIENIG